MAGRNVLSHVSSSGATFEDRLVAASFNFSAGGENVARSFSASAEDVHHALMRSPEHRKNILDPKHDTIGIGAAADSGGVVFVTEDFLERLVVLDPEPARKRAEARIQEIRRARSLPALVWDVDADALARDLARARAAGRRLPPLPASLGEMHVLFVISPKFEDLAERAAEIGSPDYLEGGLGVAFARQKESPGGAYFISLVLFPGVRDLGLSDRERGELVRAAINRIRQAHELRALTWRDALAEEAAVPATGRAAILGKNWSAVETRRHELIFSYETVDLGQLPTEFETRMRSPVLIGVGVNTAFEKTREFPRGAWRVTVVVE
jgi:hypothetical protein